MEGPEYVDQSISGLLGAVLALAAGVTVRASNGSNNNSDSDEDEQQNSPSSPGIPAGCKLGTGNSIPLAPS